jgi:pseudouridylate synthase I
LAKRKIKLIIQYDGTSYAGWQRQANIENTIQGTIEKTLSKIFGEQIYINGSGRTDAGVHALGQVADFITKSEMSCGELYEKLSKLLPEDIVVTTVKNASPYFHSRYSAIGKTYEYRLVCRENYSVFTRKYEHVIEHKPNLNLMKEAAKYIIGKHDFKSFVTHAAKQKDTIRTIKSIEIKEYQGHIVIRYKGDGFLYNMIRILTGTLLDIGFEQYAPDQIEHIINSKDRCMAGETMPSQGLFLIGVDYD